MISNRSTDWFASKFDPTEYNQTHIRHTHTYTCIYTRENAMKSQISEDLNNIYANIYSCVDIQYMAAFQCFRMRALFLSHSHINETRNFSPSSHYVCIYTNKTTIMYIIINVIPSPDGIKIRINCRGHQTHSHTYYIHIHRYIRYVQIIWPWCVAYVCI